MNKKITAIILLFMAFVGLTMVGAVSAHTVNMDKNWKKYDQGQKRIDNNKYNFWDDQLLKFTTYISPKKNEVKVFVELFKRKKVKDSPGWVWTPYKWRWRSIEQIDTDWIEIQDVEFIWYNNAYHQIGKAKYQQIPTSYSPSKFYKRNVKDLTKIEYIVGNWRA